MRAIAGSRSQVVPNKPQSVAAERAAARPPAAERAFAQRRTAAQSILVGDLERQLPGLLDPAHDQLLRRQEAHQLFLLVGVRHRAREVFGFPVTQLPHRVDAHLAQEHDVATAHPLDPHVIADIGEAQEPLLIDAALLSELAPPLRSPGSLEQPLGRADAERLQRPDLIHIEVLDVGDGIRHRILLSFSASVSVASKRQTNWPRPGIAPTISPTASSPAFSRAKPIVSRVTAWTC